MKKVILQLVWQHQFADYTNNMEFIMRSILSRKAKTLSILLLGLSVLFATNSLATPTTTEYGIILNLSGKQRMLTQKMSKQVVLIALQFEVDDNVEKLAVSSELFAKTLQGLRKGDADLELPTTSSEDILAQLTKIDKLWLEFVPAINAIIASKTVTKDQLASIASLNLPLLQEMNKCVKLYEKDSYGSGIIADPGLSVSINLAGKQRMLTQKMSKEFFLIAYGYEVGKNKANLTKTYSLFDRTLQGLLHGDSTLNLSGTKSPSFIRQLKRVERLWYPFMELVSYAADSKNASIARGQIKTVAETNIPLLKQMDKVVGMYKRQANEQY